MIKALDTIEQRRMSSKTTEIQKTIAEKVKISIFNQPIEKTRLLIVFGYRYLQGKALLG